MKKTLCFAATLTLILVFSQQAGSSEIIILFDELFVRGTRAPSMEFRRFEGYDRSATIEIFNGGLPDSQDNRTSNAVVKVNGETLFGPSKLDRSRGYLQKEVMLVTGENTLGVELRGKPGGRIRVRVSQIRPQRDYSGIYCLNQVVCKDKNSTSLEIFQTGSAVTFIFTDDRGVVYTARTVDGNEMTLTIDIPDGQGQFIIAIRFSDDGRRLKGLIHCHGNKGPRQGTVGFAERSRRSYLYAVLSHSRSRFSDPYFGGLSMGVSPLGSPLLAITGSCPRRSHGQDG
jgi:hypothetical protein